nr:replication protein P [uncultured Pseudomonas sp.]
MRNAIEIVKHVDFSQARPAVQQQPTSIDEGTAQVVNALFNELKSIFPAWKQAWPDDEALTCARIIWPEADVA